MGLYIEPVYLNKKMVMNCAAYFFKGVSLETEETEAKNIKIKGAASIGFKFLQDLISPLSVSADGEKDASVSKKTAGRYTLGGLHMSLIDVLNEGGHIKRDVNIATPPDRDQFVEFDVLLKPIDFFNIIEISKMLTPLIAQVVQNFGSKINQNIFTSKVMSDIQKYEKLLSDVLAELENDYLKSGQLEMLMIDPVSGRQLGVVDIDLSDLSATAVKAKLTDGHFKVIGRVYRHVSHDDRISIVQRTIISSALSVVEKIVGPGSEGASYRKNMDSAKEVVERVCQFYIQGPAVRIMAMSICI